MNIKTAFSTGPGFYAAVSALGEPTLPADTMRLYMARIEAYDGPKSELTPDVAMSSFALLPTMAIDRPAVARALLELHAALSANLGLLREEARG